jgi:hypothetical protein
MKEAALHQIRTHQSILKQMEDKGTDDQGDYSSNELGEFYPKWQSQLLLLMVVTIKFILDIDTLIHHLIVGVHGNRLLSSRAE